MIRQWLLALSLAWCTSAAAAERSIAAQVPVTIAVLNESPRTVTLWWVDYDGREVARGTIRPGQRWDQRTFLTHPWRVRDAVTSQLMRDFITDENTPALMVLR
jgi:hypothetical protein